MYPHIPSSEIEKRYGIKPLACPFCNSEYAVVYAGKSVSVECFGCGAEGPHVHGTDSDVRVVKAVEAWNRAPRNG